MPLHSISCVDSQLQNEVLLGENRRFSVSCAFRSTLLEVCLPVEEYKRRHRLWPSSFNPLTRIEITGENHVNRVKTHSVDGHYAA